ncbi:MAG: polysaccharide deacetylase family protein [Armatimonadia bacterium]
MKLKRLVQKAAFSSGFTASWGRRRHSRVGVTTLEIFYGHHVLPDDAQAPDLKASRLRERLDYLRHTRDLVTFDDGLAALQRPKDRLRLATLTFDDGYRDNLRTLLPILQDYSTPALIYVSTGPIMQGSGLWFDQVRTALRLSRLTALNLPWLSERFSDNISLTYMAMERLRRVGPAERQALVEELLNAVPAECRTLLPHQEMLTVPELQELAADPLITIGAHTHSHSVLSSCSETEARTDLQDNLTTLQLLLGQQPIHFAYPNGQPADFTARDQALLRESGLTTATTTVRGLNLPGADRFALPRSPLGEGPVDRFAWQIERGVRQ